jgi:hypothetical protein
MSDCVVYKSTAVEFLDDFYGGGSEELKQAFDSALDLLRTDRPLVDRVSQLERDGRLSPGAADEFRAYWLAETSQLAGKEVDRVLRHGFREAIELARSSDPPRPIETFWVTGASDEFEVHICEGKRQVTVIMLIPLVRRYGSKRARSKSWAVRVGGLRDADAERLDEHDPATVKIQLSGA